MVFMKNRNEINRENIIDTILADEGFDWQDVVIFALDDYLEILLGKLGEEGVIEELSKDAIFEMADLIKDRTRDAIGKPLMRV